MNIGEILKNVMRDQLNAISASTSGLWHAVCLTGMERSFSEIGGNIHAAVYSLLGTPAAQIVFFGVKPANDTWQHIHSWLPLQRVEEQDYCTVPVPRWYGCQAHGRVECRHNFVQELCDLDVCERMIRRYERRKGRVFDTVMRLRPDVYWEARVSFPPVLGPNTVVMPYMDAGGGVNDHVAFGGRAGMRSFLTRVRQLNQNMTEADYQRLGVPPPAQQRRKFKMMSEVFLKLALARDGMRALPLRSWMYCLHTKKALLDQRGVYGCIARLRARSRCTSLACGRNDMKYWCHCFNDTCAHVKAGRPVASLGPSHLPHPAKAWSMRAGWVCTDVQDTQLRHPGCPWRSHDYGLNYPGVTPLRWPVLARNASPHVGRCPGEVRPNNACGLSVAGFKWSRCAANATYGCVDHDSMWAGKGCKAIFLCNGFQVKCGARARNMTCFCTATSSRLVEANASLSVQ